MKAEILVGPERRRRWSAGERASIVAEAAMAGANVAEISRRHGISRASCIVGAAKRATKRARR